MKKMMMSLIVSLLFVSSAFAYEYVPSRFNVLILMDPARDVVMFDGVEYIWNNGWFVYRDGSVHFMSRDRLPMPLKNCTGHDIKLEKQNIASQWNHNHNYRYNHRDYPPPQTHPSYYKNREHREYNHNYQYKNYR